ncbi:hypothetical protein ACJZ2D_010888 [Fusarium nematophilum]
MTDMKEFDIIRVARSDGADTGPGYWPVTAPTVATTAKKPKDATSAEKTPRTKPQMIRLTEDDPRFTEWRVKLGILLKQELCPNPDEGNPWLVQFPRGYWLYEKSKHLWVSGYPIKAKLFKSPQEFAVHLIWLLSTSMDYRDCCCAHCNASNPAKGGSAADELIITQEPPKGEKLPPKVTPNGSTWRLGIIAASGSGHYELMPIGHGRVQQNNVTKTDGDMRPFYAFTVPPVALAELKDKQFDGVPWEAMLQGAADAGRRELIALDASKMAAVKIDYSYSLWSPLSEDANGKTITYYGCFFGAERVEIGDAMRLRSLPAELNVPAETGVLGLRFIFTTKDFPGAVFFRGHIYQLVTEDKPNVVREEHLPIALRKETQWRNSIGTRRWRWILVKENVVFKEQSIRGRFYPTHRLMPILNPNGFQQAVAQGQVDDQYAHLNNRMDGTGRYLGRKVNRLDTLGASVTHTAKLNMESYIREEALTGNPSNDST